MQRLRILVLPLLAVVGLSGCWMNARGGPGNDGLQPFEGRLTTSSVSSLRLAWRGVGHASDVPAVADLTHVFVAGSTINAYPFDGGSSCTGGVCNPEWFYGVGGQIRVPPAPALSGGFVYAVSPERGPGDLQSRLFVFPETPNPECLTFPPECDPVWSADLPGPLPSTSAPVVADGRVYVATAYGFVVYDAAGRRNCSGTPTKCTPLWSGRGVTVPHVGLGVANGHVYLPTDGNRIVVFDAAGVEGCSGSPSECLPQFQLWPNPYPEWSGHFNNVAISGGRAYGVNRGTLHVFDATGASCSGVPKVCLPLWSAEGARGVPAIDGQRLYVARGVNPSPAGGEHELAAYDLDDSGCSGSPKVCSPEWTAPGVRVRSDKGGPSVANGVVYIPTVDGHLFAFAASGCPATNGVCQPLVDVALPEASYSPPVVAGGHVFVGSASSYHVYAYTVG